VRIPALDIVVKPSFAWRGQYYAGLMNYLPKTSLDNLDRWWTFNRTWATDADTSHSFSKIVPNELYDTHPEYFPLVNGKRLRGDLHADSSEVQRCLSHPDVLRRAIEYSARQFETNPDLRFTSLSANDAGSPQGGFCQCANCAALGKTPSHQLLAFANSVANANERQYPDRGYVFYAYRHTLGAPDGMKAHRNVVPMICPLDNCRAHSLLSACPDVAGARAAILGWHQVAGRIAYRPYNSAGAFDLPGILTMTEELRFARDHGSIGGFREYNGSPQANSAMRNWMDTKLMWSIDQDPVELRRQFIAGYYGTSAAEAIVKVYDKVENGIRNSSFAPRPESDYGHNYMNSGFVKPLAASCRADIEAAFNSARTEQDSRYRQRIVRDMSALLGETPADLAAFL
jgi:hypothetical protein